MTGRAAGRAGGRPAAAVVVLAAALAVLPLSVLPPSPAAAAPLPAAAPTPEPTADPADPADPTTAVRIDLSRLDPRTLAPGGTVTVGGTLTNTGGDPLTSLAVRLQRGDPLAGRADLDQPQVTDAATAPFTDVPGTLEPGASLGFTYTATAEDLRLVDDGVYPALVNVNGTHADGRRERVGELSTQLVLRAAVPPARPAVAWLWPLVDRPHRDASGAFTDDDLTGAVRAGGRLDRALAAVEQAPASGTSVTLVVDPELVGELATMAAGPYSVAGRPGAGTDAAAAFLTRLRAAATLHPVAALPYADADVDALAAAGLPGVLTRTLPGSAQATAADALPGGDTTAAPGSPPPDGSQPTNGSVLPDGTAPVTAGPTVPAAPPAGAGARLLASELGVTPRVDLAWPAGGVLRTQALAALQAAGTGTVVLSPAGLTDGGAASGGPGRPAAARSTVPGPGGPVTALVADDALSGLAGGATAAGDVRVTEQRYLAELALAAQQAPDGAQTLLVAPPREVDVVPAGVSAMISDATSQLWLAPAGLTDLAGGPSVDAGGLADPPDDAALDGPAMADVARAVSVRDDLAAAVADDPAAALAPYDAGTARAVSVAWRGQPDAFAAAAAGLRATLEQLRGRVTLLAPADGDYSLASSDAPLVLTVDNDLPFAVRVRLDVQSRTQWLTTEDIGPQVLAPDARTTLQVPTEARRSGGSTVTATLTTPSGRALGATVVLQVKSTVYGRISLVTTVAAGALLGLLFLRRAVRFVIARVRGRGPDEDEDALGGAPEGAVPATPPTRSPV